MNEIVDYYNDIAAEYDNGRFNNTYGSFIDHEERRWLNLMSDREEFGRTLEIACGTGRLTEYAHVGIDASREMLAIAKKKHPGKQFLEADAREIPLPAESFDTIYSFHLMMHLPKADIMQIISEAHRLLKPGGRLIFDIPSRKRRKLLRKDRGASWHGSTSLSVKEIEAMADGMFGLEGVFGILFLPIHKMPKRLRKSFQAIDESLCRSRLKEYSSYLLIELRKS